MENKLNNPTQSTTQISQYEQHLIDESKSSNTIKSYLSHINGFLKFIQNTNPNTNINLTSSLSLTRKHTLTYLSHLKSKHQSAQTICAKLSAIRSYNEWLISTNQQKETIIISADFPEIQKSIVSPAKVTDKEVIKFLNKIKENESYRNYTIASFMYYVGTRISETLDVLLDDIDLTSGTCIIRNGKGNKYREVYLNNNIISILKEYLLTERSNSKYAEQSPYLFTSRQGEKITSYQTIEVMFDRYSKKINPHQLRHCMGTWAVTPKDQGGAGLTLQQLAGQLGHTTIQTTTKYTHPRMETLRSMLNR